MDYSGWDGSVREDLQALHQEAVGQMAKVIFQTKQSLRIPYF